ncbi:MULTISPECIES: hypothetical protein [Burkholderia]|uniref:hypothetical protein n=1 Tax=Burkholderia TaxID=32008 RepID=UPI0015832409|nr:MULTISPECIES: hypothetical protein [Burkholderia]
MRTWKKELAAPVITCISPDIRTALAIGTHGGVPVMLDVDVKRMHRPPRQNSCRPDRNLNLS